MFPSYHEKEILDIQTVVQLVQWVQRLFCFTHMRLCTLLYNAYIIYIHACVRQKDRCTHCTNCTHQPHLYTAQVHLYATKPHLCSRHFTSSR